MPTQTRNIAPIYSCFKSIDLKLPGYPITDKRLLSCMGDAIQSSSANIVSATDYSPFGAPLPGRTFSANEYRFGFNSKEKDNETYGDGNTYDFGARIYDARLGSWLSLDPLQAKYPSLTPYHFTGNNPIIHIDKDGKDYEIVIDHKAKTITVVATYYVAEGNIEDKAGAMAGISVWNKASGVYEYKTGGVSYKINFNLTVKEVKDPIESANKDASGNSYAINNEAVVLIGGKNALGAAAKEGETNAKHIVVKKNRPDEVDPHEVGHTLGLGHFYKGFMRKYTGKLNVSNKVILGYVAEILKDNRLGSRQSIIEGEEDRKAPPKNNI